MICRCCASLEHWIDDKARRRQVKAEDVGISNPPLGLTHDHAADRDILAGLALAGFSRRGCGQVGVC